jgi:hypothetical protein
MPPGLMAAAALIVLTALLGALVGLERIRAFPFKDHTRNKKMRAASMI